MHVNEALSVGDSPSTQWLREPESPEMSAREEQAYEDEEAWWRLFDQGFFEEESA